MICPGRVYRKDLDATHLPMFHQLEALVVDEGISLADLKGTAPPSGAASSGVGRDPPAPRLLPLRRAGVRVRRVVPRVRRKGCRVCKGTGWIELGGAGMVHPAVFEAVGIDPERYTGFAFGLGIDRIAMMRHAIDDLRLLVEGDVRFLEQFAC
jgi:phenylalanyl-tRNA synthetase alpha chain